MIVCYIYWHSVYFQNWVGSEVHLSDKTDILIPDSQIYFEALGQLPYWFQDVIRALSAWTKQIWIRRLNLAKYQFCHLNELPILLSFGDIEKNVFLEAAILKSKMADGTRGLPTWFHQKICSSRSNLPLCQISRFYPALHGPFCFLT